MKKAKSDITIEKVARHNGVSEDEVRREIQTAIDLAMANPDPGVREYWAKIPRKGDKPTPEEAILYISGQIKMK